MVSGLCLIRNGDSPPATQDLIKAKDAIIPDGSVEPLALSLPLMSEAYL
ncbi:hypothetical protein ES703_120599 [subsurface metagenome]